MFDAKFMFNLIFYVMKTFNYLRSKTTKILLAIVAVLLLAINSSIFSQEVRSVFGTDTVTKYVWGIELKTTDIQNEFGTQYGMYAGALFNHYFMVGMVGVLNVTHPTVNYGYMGLMVKYIYKPVSILHLSAQFTFGSGATRDYQTEKSSLLDNFGNIYGTNFYFIEPEINTEVSLGNRTVLVLGIGYRLVGGINPENNYLSLTHLNNKDLSGITINAGIQFRLH
jgi:hypothetical protein